MINNKKTVTVKIESFLSENGLVMPLCNNHVNAMLKKAVQMLISARLMNSHFGNLVKVSNGFK
jgi:hypothetical protein